MDNQLVLKDDARVSRRHAQLRKREGDILIVDLGSGNGTYLNGQRIPAQTELALKDGDVLRLGAYQITFVGY